MCNNKGTVQFPTQNLIQPNRTPACNPPQPPKYSVSFIAKRLKGRSSRILRQEFPELKEWYKSRLWAPSCYHGSVGHGWEIVGKYIAGQDKKSKG